MSGNLSMFKGFFFALCSKGTDFNDFSTKSDVCEAKTSTDQQTIAEKFFDIFGTGIGSNIKVFRGLFQ